MGNNLKVNVPVKIVSEDNLKKPLYAVPYQWCSQIRQGKPNYVSNKPLIGHQVFIVSQSL